VALSRGSLEFLRKRRSAPRGALDGATHARVFHTFGRLFLLVRKGEEGTGSGFKFEIGEIQRRHATDGAEGCCGASMQ
jgi:hypothetical protein